MGVTAMCADRARSADLNNHAHMTPPVGFRRPMASSDARRLAAHALRHGAVQVHPLEVHWDLAGRCKSPVAMQLEGRPEVAVKLPGSDELAIGGIHAYRGEVYFDYAVPKDSLFTVLLKTKCRRCDQCLRSRAREWRLRAQVETGEAARTWFGTMTLRPEEHFKARLVASSRLRARGVSLDALSPQEQFAEINATISREITLALKRMRKNSGAELRYISVVEEHKSGLPHYHLLIHEVLEDKPITWRQLSDAWRLGFSNWKLVHDGRAAAYVTKYLSKSMLARVRASKRYGKNDLKSVEKEFFPSKKRKVH